MAVDLGDLYRLSMTLTSPAGGLVNADTMTLTITLPDGSTAPNVVAPTSTGHYQYDYLTVQAGRHIAHWVGTGTNPGAYVDFFDVLPAAPMSLISLASAKAQLKITSDDSDEELRGYIEASTYAVEHLAGEAIVRRSVTEQQDAHGGVMVLKVTPVIALTSLATLDGSQSWDVSLLHPTPAGVVHLRHLVGWTRCPLLVTYQVGYAVVQANYLLAASIIIEHLWQTKRGSKGGPNVGGMQDTMMPRGLGFAVPNRAIELIGDGMPGVA